MIWPQDREQLLRRAVPDVRGPILLRVDLPRGRRVAYVVVDLEGDGGDALFIHRGPRLSDAHNCAPERRAIVSSSVFEIGVDVIQRLVRTVNRLHRFCTD